jgi:ubiquinol-cytochrome c reductase cytochrome c subunit
VGAESADFMLSTGRMPIAAVEEQPPRRPPAYTSAEIAELTAYVASLGPGPDIPAVDPAAGDLGEGADLYEENCAACHSSTGVGGALTSGLQAPSIMDSTARQVAEAIRLGGAGLRTGKMPKFGPDALSDQQVDSIIRYVEYLQHPNDRGGASLAHIGPVAEGFVAWVGALLLLLLFIRWIGKRTA